MSKLNKIPEVRFNLKSATGTTPTPIYAIFRFQDQRLKFGTGHKVNPKHWNRRTQRTKMIRGKEEVMTKINTDLDKLRDQIREIYAAYDYNVSVDELRESLNEKHREKPPVKSKKADPLRPSSFMEFVDLYHRENKDNPQKKRGTWKVWLTALNHLKSYCKKRGLYDEAKDVYHFNYDSLTFTWRDILFYLLPCLPYKYSLPTGCHLVSYPDPKYTCTLLESP